MSSLRCASTGWLMRTPELSHSALRQVQLGVVASVSCKKRALSVERKRRALSVDSCSNNDDNNTNNNNNNKNNTDNTNHNIFIKV